jgi:hypothetical protein
MNETAVVRLDLLINIGTGLAYCFRMATTRDLDSAPRLVEKLSHMEVAGPMPMPIEPLLGS